ncbi:hypothetical protein [Terriglobus roseus]|nr:hypothetical protein [Terriglobus roseus]
MIAVMEGFRGSTTTAKLVATAMEEQLLKRIRVWLTVFIVGLILSGVTAFPLETELGVLVAALRQPSVLSMAQGTHLLPWVEHVYAALRTTNANYPFLAYGTDWLAFGHLVIAVAFIGPWIDPVRNKWFVTFGLIACAGVIPLAIFAGAVRGIPFGWRLIDCSFGVFGSIPLLLVQRDIQSLEAMGYFTTSTSAST